MSKDHVPILEVSDENFHQLWPMLKGAIKEASFIALDCELSGLGNRSKINCSEIDIRYQNIRDIAQEYAIVSLGISCFRHQSSASTDPKIEVSHRSGKVHNYIVQTFNVLTICSTNYIVEYNSIRFLLSHGFDFNRQYSHGLPYLRGEERENRKVNGPSIRDLFNLVIRAQKPIVLHNGLVDLIFLYQSFYADLPRNVETFAADLLEMFPAGVYDTKYISEFHQTFSATFLEYLFKKLQLENDARRRRESWHCCLHFPSYSRPEGVKGLRWHKYLQVFDHTEEQQEEGQKPLCNSYKFHGWCPKATNCLLSHSVDRIVWELPNPKNRKRKVHPGSPYSSSVAQFINFKKNKMEEEKRNSISRNTEGELVENQRISSPDTASSQGKFSLSCEASRNSVAESSSDIDSEKNNSHSANGLLPLNNERIGDINTSHSEEVISRNGCNSDNSNISNSFHNPAGETPTDGPRERDCSGHSAGFDAFMTGFIFACDVAILGQLPHPEAFQNPNEMNLQHVAGRVYLIGKEFPFLVRSSAYKGTSSAHDRIIKVIRGANGASFEMEIV